MIQIKLNRWQNLKYDFVKFRVQHKCKYIILKRAQFAIENSFSEVYGTLQWSAEKEIKSILDERDCLILVKMREQKIKHKHS